MEPSISSEPTTTTMPTEEPTTTMEPSISSEPTTTAAPTDFSARGTLGVSFACETNTVDVASADCNIFAESWAVELEEMQGLEDVRAECVGIIPEPVALAAFSGGRRVQELEVERYRVSMNASVPLSNGTVRDAQFQIWEVMTSLFVPSSAAIERVENGTNVLIGERPESGFSGTVRIFEDSLLTTPEFTANPTSPPTPVPGDDPLQTAADCLAAATAIKDVSGEGAALEALDLLQCSADNVLAALAGHATAEDASRASDLTAGAFTQLVRVADELVRYSDATTGAMTGTHVGISKAIPPLDEIFVRLLQDESEGPALGTQSIEAARTIAEEAEVKAAGGHFDQADAEALLDGLSAALRGRTPTLNMTSVVALIFDVNGDESAVLNASRIVAVRASSFPGVAGAMLETGPRPNGLGISASISVPENDTQVTLVTFNDAETEANPDAEQVVYTGVQSFAVQNASIATVSFDREVVGPEARRGIAEIICSTPKHCTLYEPRYEVTCQVRSSMDGDGFEAEPRCVGSLSGSIATCTCFDIPLLAGSRRRRLQLGESSGSQLDVVAVLKAVPPDLSFHANASLLVPLLLLLLLYFVLLWYGHTVDEQDHHVPLNAPVSVEDDAQVLATSPIAGKKLRGDETLPRAWMKTSIGGDSGERKWYGLLMLQPEDLVRFHPEPLMRRIWAKVRDEHEYLQIIFLHDSRGFEALDRFSRILLVGVSLFSYLAVNATIYFTVQNDGDYGDECFDRTDRDTCEDERSALNPSQDLCSWDGARCLASDVDDASFQTALTIAALAMVLMVPIEVLLTTVFEKHYLSKAPNADHPDTPEGAAYDDFLQRLAQREATMTADVESELNRVLRGRRNLGIFRYLPPFFLRFRVWSSVKEVVRLEAFFGAQQAMVSRGAPADAAKALLRSVRQGRHRYILRMAIRDTLPFLHRRVFQCSTEVQLPKPPMPECQRKAAIGFLLAWIVAAFIWTILASGRGTDDDSLHWQFLLSVLIGEALAILLLRPVAIIILRIVLPDAIRQDVHPDRIHTHCPAYAAAMLFVRRNYENLSGRLAYLIDADDDGDDDGEGSLQLELNEASETPDGAKTPDTEEHRLVADGEEDGAFPSPADSQDGKDDDATLPKAEILDAVEDIGAASDGEAADGAAAHGAQQRQRLKKPKRELKHRPQRDPLGLSGAEQREKMSQPKISTLKSSTITSTLKSSTIASSSSSTGRPSHHRRRRSRRHSLRSNSTLFSLEDLQTVVGGDSDDEDRDAFLKDDRTQRAFSVLDAPLSPTATLRRGQIALAEDSTARAAGTRSRLSRPSDPKAMLELSESLETDGSGAKPEGEETPGEGAAPSAEWVATLNKMPVEDVGKVLRQRSCLQTISSYAILAIFSVVLLFPVLVQPLLLQQLLPFGIAFLVILDFGIDTDDEQSLLSATIGVLIFIALVVVFVLVLYFIDKQILHNVRVELPRLAEAKSMTFRESDAFTDDLESHRSRGSTMSSFFSPDSIMRSRMARRERDKKDVSPILTRKDDSVEL